MTSQRLEYILHHSAETQLKERKALWSQIAEPIDWPHKKIDDWIELNALQNREQFAFFRTRTDGVAVLDKVAHRLYVYEGGTAQAKGERSTYQFEIPPRQTNRLSPKRPGSDAWMRRHGFCHTSISTFEREFYEGHKQTLGQLATGAKAEEILRELEGEAQTGRFQGISDVMRWAGAHEAAALHTTVPAGFFEQYATHPAFPKTDAERIRQMEGKPLIEAKRLQHEWVKSLFETNEKIIQQETLVPKDEKTRDRNWKMMDALYDLQAALDSLFISRLFPKTNGAPFLSINLSATGLSAEQAQAWLWAEKMVPPVARKAIAKQLRNVSVQPKILCSYYDDGQIVLRPESSGAAVVHEFGHLWEVAGKWGSILGAWRDAKAWPVKVAGTRVGYDPPWGDGVLTVVGAFVTPYVGRIYDDQHTEVLSCGLEALYRSPANFYARNREHALLVSFVLRRGIWGRRQIKNE